MARDQEWQNRWKTNGQSYNHLHESVKSQKSVVRGKQGAVVSQHIAASEVGARILKEGGNAVDAAIATSFAISILEPWMSGIGGGGYMVVYEAATKTVKTLHFGMKSPKALDVNEFTLEENAEGGDLFSWPKVKGDINVNGWKAIGVPGLLAGVAKAHEKWGTKKWAELLSPAITLAQEGVPVTWMTTLRVASHISELAADAGAGSVFAPSGVPPVATAGKAMGFLPNPALVTSLRAIAKDGADVMYDGALGESLAKDVQARGGWLSSEDLKDYEVFERDALSFVYRDKTVHTIDHMSAGPSLQMAMQSLPSMAGNTPSAEHVANWAIALKDAYAYRFENMGDVDESADPSCTTHINVIDGEGNMVSLTQTLLSLFGAKVLAPESGILMNNGIMWFDPRDGRMNSLAPNKRPLSNMSPLVVTHKDAEPWGTFGGAGGRRIFPSLLQLLSYQIDFGFDLEAAFHAPRIDVSGIDNATVSPGFDGDVLAKVTEIIPAEWLEHSIFPASYATSNGIRWHGPDGVSAMSDPYHPLAAALSADLL